MRAGSQKKRPGAEEQLALPRIVLAVPFPAVRHVTYWLDRPQPAPAGAVSSSPGDHLVERSDSLRFRRLVNEKLRDGGDKLRRGERLFQKDAVRDAPRGPFAGAGAGHVDDGKFRVDLSGLLGDFPSVPPAPQSDVGHKGPVAAPVSP